MRRVILTISALAIVSAASAQTPLTDYLKLVEENNPTLQAASEAANAEGYAAIASNNLSDPQVGFEYGWNVPSESGSETGISVSQEFDFPTAYINRSRVAESRTATAWNDYAALRTEILLEAQMAYMEYITTSQTLALKEEQAEHSERAAEIFAQMAKSGEVSLPDLSKARHAAISAREAVVMTSLELADKGTALRTLAGGESIVPTDYTPSPVKALGEMTSIYLEESPVLLAAKSRLGLATAELKVEKSMALPKLSVGYTTKQASGGAKVNAISSGISIPIFSSRATVKRAAAEERAASAELRAVEVEVVAQLESLYEQLSIIDATLGSLEKMFGDDNYPAMLGRLLKSGEIGAVEYFSELGSYYDAQESILRLQLEYNKISAEINKISL
ncbi:MAG: TolC family protein [Tidjanibacter sp.]|nr:TolC family protein [Tidjanibacter sp.]